MAKPRTSIKPEAVPLVRDLQDLGAAVRAAQDPAGLSKALLKFSNHPFFDLRPIEVGGFKFKDRFVVPIGRPTLDGFHAALLFAAHTEQSSAFWIGDLVAYAVDRADWREKLSQAMDVSGLAEQTLHNYGYLSRHVKGPARALVQTIGHASAVAKLEADEQLEVLTLSQREGWNAYELRKQIRARSRRQVIDGQAVLEGQYRVLYADPPWSYRSNVTPDDGALGKASRHYPTLSIGDLCKLPIAAHAQPDAVLFLWTTASLLLENPGPREVLEAWGFTPKTNMVWDKVLGNWGHYVRAHHEHLIIATRGSCLPDEPTPMPDSVQTIRRSDEHSAKPVEFRRIIEKLYTRGPYLELFGRARVDGWTVFGNDARLWAEERQAATA